MSNEWHDKGELPPAGTECEFHFWKSKWVKATIPAIVQDAHGDFFAIAQMADGFSFSSDVSKFRPIKSERDKAIESISNVIFESAEIIAGISFKSAKDVAGKLYDAGYRKVKQ
jgi:S-methylmethionine-dependent homocysteine/selenocysteine methylase